jgi:hypothetical protein
MPAVEPTAEPTAMPTVEPTVEPAAPASVEPRRALALVEPAGEPRAREPRASAPRDSVAYVGPDGGVSSTAAGDDGGPRAIMGVGLQEIPALLAAHLPDDALGGVVLTQVFENGPAAKAGLRVYDVVVSLDGHHELGGSAVRDLMDAHEPGSSVEVVYLRKGARRVAVVELVQSRALRTSGAARGGSVRSLGEVSGGVGSGPSSGRVRVPSGDGPSAAPAPPQHGYAIGSDGRVYVWPDAADGYVEELRPGVYTLRDGAVEAPAPVPSVPRVGPAGDDRMKVLEERMRRIESMLERLLEKRDVR